MARRTFERIDANLALRVGNRTDVSPIMRSEWINDALLRCSNEYEHPEMEGICIETLVTGTDSIFPITVTDLWWPVMVKNSASGAICRPADRERLEQGITKTPGPPSRFYWWNNRFYFDSTANADIPIKIWYRRLPAEWTTGISVLAKAYDLILELYSSENALNFLREFDKAELAAREAKAYVSDMNLPKRAEKLNDYKTGLQAGDRWHK
jgi:hypothetical protein